MSDGVGALAAASRHRTPDASVAVAVSVRNPERDRLALASAERHLGDAELAGRIRSMRPFERCVLVRVSLGPDEGIRAAALRVGQGVEREVRRQLGEHPWVGIALLTASTQQALQSTARDALRAIEVGCRYLPGPTVVLHEDLLPVAAIDADPSIRVALAKVLDPLAVHDRRRQTRVLESLELYLARDLSLAATARALGIHRHTLEGRLGRAEQILGRDLRSGADRLVIQLALLARRFRSGGP